jgi:hypothetical protein
VRLPDVQRAAQAHWMLGDTRQIRKVVLIADRGLSAS